jgi:hypothetical protein
MEAILMGCSQMGRSQLGLLENVLWNPFSIGYRSVQVQKFAESNVPPNKMMALGLIWNGNENACHGSTLVSTKVPIGLNFLSTLIRSTTPSRINPSSLVVLELMDGIRCQF